LTVATGEQSILWKSRSESADEFEQVALVHLDALYQTALRLTHNRAEAEDLVQEAYLRAFRSFHRFNPGTNCRAWLFTIMRNGSSTSCGMRGGRFWTLT
jgi:RNA polymerase sigma-70 factor (ECF subfamily)